MSDPKRAVDPAVGDRQAEPAEPADPAARRSKFNAATDGWDAYNNWLDRVRKPGAPSRQAVIAKALYSVSSYKNWADKAKDAFDKDK
jgi:hypothetical protein